MQIKRYYLLDVVRGFAAFVILFWHFQHFYYELGGKTVDGYNRKAQPFYDTFSLFYERGADAVQLFWVLSGYVFFAVYLSLLNERKVTGFTFFISRFSRLYPLHFVTLIIVLILQTISQNMLGDSIIYHDNDLKHFLLNLTFISHWGFQDDWSFNAPIWSVSLELFAYLVFFVFARLGLRSLASTLVMVGLAVWAATVHVGYGGFWFGWVTACFFMGGAAHLICLELSKAGSRQIIGGILLCLCVLYFSTKAMPNPPLFVTARWMKALVLFPTLVLVFGLLQHLRPQTGRSIAFFGDTAYSSYLIHVPIQMIVLLSYQMLGLPLNPTPIFLGIYLVGVFVISYFVFVGFERPAQNYIRRKLGAPRRRKVDGGPSE